MAADTRMTERRPDLWLCKADGHEGDEWKFYEEPECPHAEDGEPGHNRLLPVFIGEPQPPQASERERIAEASHMRRCWCEHDDLGNTTKRDPGCDGLAAAIRAGKFAPQPPQADSGDLSTAFSRLVDDHRARCPGKGLKAPASLCDICKQAPRIASLIRSAEAPIQQLGRLTDANE